MTTPLNHRSLYSPRPRDAVFAAAAASIAEPPCARTTAPAAASPTSFEDPPASCVACAAASATSFADLPGGGWKVTKKKGRSVRVLKVNRGRLEVNYRKGSISSTQHDQLAQVDVPCAIASDAAASHET